VSALGELFLFKEGDLVFAQTSGTQPVIYDGNAYEPRALGHDDIQVKDDVSKQKLEVTTSLSNPIARRYFAKPVDRVVTLDLFQQDINGTSIIWKGRLTSTRQAGPTEVALVFESIFTSLRRPGLRARYQKSCRVALYGRGCFLNPEDWRVDAQLLSVDGNNLTMSDLSSYPAGRFRGGMVRGPDTSVRFIMAQTGNVLTLSRPWPELADALAASGYGQSYGLYYGQLELPIYPGCPHNLDGCESFDNVLNYRGFPWIPGRNPFTNSLV